MDNKSFQVSVKGLIIKDNKVLLLHEQKGTWDLPGGRLQHGENFEQTLKRECQEEIGVKCEVLDKNPAFSWVAQDSVGIWRIMLCFRIKPEHFDFIHSDECIGYDFFDKDAINTINIVPQIGQLKDFL
ncbi:MAG: NUDIX hydrolase [Bacteroidales bacterium]|nr:NUDIX hydrolase [Bacteroidales bacterium]